MAEAGVRSRGLGRETVVMSRLIGEQNVRKKARGGIDLRPCEREPMTRGLWKVAELSPAGPSGLGPLHLRQASGFAGGR